MSRIKKITITLFIIFLTVLLGNYIVNGLYKVGEIVTLGTNDLSTSKDILCVEHKQFMANNKKYKVISRVHIEGKTSTDHKGKKIDNKLNAKLAYILSSYKTSTTLEGNSNSQIQNAIWNNMYTWVQKVGQYHEGLYVEFASNVKGKDNKLQKEAANYAKSLKNNKLVNKTDEKKIKVEAYGQSELKIGPFNVEFSGKLKTVQLTDKNRKKYTPTKFGVYSGKTFKTVNLNDIKSKQNFYIIIPTSSGIYTIGHINMTSATTVKAVDIVFLKNQDDPGAKYQNLIQYQPSEAQIEAKGEWNTTIESLANVSGFVWEDVKPEGKGAKGDSLYNNKNEIDKRPVDTMVTVILKDKNGNEIARKENVNNEYKFTNILISRLEGSYVEFIYDGLQYTTVTPKVDKDLDGKSISGAEAINSKAQEDATKRREINQSFAEITNSGNIEDRAHGNSRKAAQNGQKIGDVTGTLTYNNNPQQWESKFASTTGNTSVIASTKIAKYNIYENLKEGANGVKEANNINLGLRSRIQPHLSVENDLENVEIKINGYSHLYKYLKTEERLKLEKERMQNAETDEELENSLFNVGVKFGERNPDDGYQRAIYPSDIAHSMKLSEINEDDPNKLKVYATYNITIDNRTLSLNSEVNELVNYYDERYTIVDSWIGDNQNNKIEWTDSSSYGQNYSNTGLKASYTTSLDNTKINAAQSLTIHIRFQVNDNAIKKLLENDATLYNITEIYSYSTYYKENNEGCEAGEIYAGIDKVSAPGNAIPSAPEEGEKIDRSTYEADTNDAPSLKLEAKGVRSIEGTVFEDETTVANNERKGNGIYDNDEKSVKGVKVEILNEDLSIAQIYKNVTDINGEKLPNINKEPVPAVFEYTEEDGKYELYGLEPGHYYIRFTYENGKTKIVDTSTGKDVTVQDYKSTLITSNTIKQAFENEESNLTWYKEKDKRYSDARDDYEKRQDIDKELTELDTAKTPTITSLYANTPKFDIGIEYESTETDAVNADVYILKITDIDFGIAERPKQSAELNKQVSNIMIKSPNEQAYGGKVDEENGIAPEGMMITPNGIYVTIENNKIYGSQITIDYNLSIKNTSELDYISPEYYYYGEITGNPVKFSKATLVDYVDREMVIKAGQEGNWTVLGNTLDFVDKGINVNIKDEEKEQLLKQFSTIVIAEPISAGEFLAPGETSQKTITVEKLLSTPESTASLDDDLSFNNNGEIVTIHKDGGSNMTATLGNYASRLVENPEAAPEKSGEAKALSVTITVPFGEDNYATYAIIAVASLVIIGLGAYGTKKFLKK